MEPPKGTDMPPPGKFTISWGLCNLVISMMESVGNQKENKFYLTGRYPNEET